MSAIIAKLIALFLAHRAPEAPPKATPVHKPTPAFRYIEGERVPYDHDEDDHEDDDGWQHNSEECEAW